MVGRDGRAATRGGTVWRPGPMSAAFLLTLAVSVGLFLGGLWLGFALYMVPVLLLIGIWATVRVRDKILVEDAEEWSDGIALGIAVALVIEVALTIWLAAKTYY